ncbi:MAG: bifunctional phosphoribosylaminoimidazolecarboxamide formyltransferase/IMP cyclohydrolase [Actinomycetota bacterium]
MPAMAMKRALISVSDKSGVVELARALVEADYEIVSSGGTAKALSDAGVSVVRVADVTGAPEILDGRVKTLHPKIHGGILADRRKESHRDELAAHDIEAIDLVVVNLYPFEQTVARAAVSEDEALEQIDIGGPALVRAAAKNWHSVAVVVNPDRYERVIDEIRSAGEVSRSTRRALSVEAFAHTAAYDAAIVEHFGDQEEWPERFILAGAKIMDLRYGENPHQEAAFYASGASRRGLAAAEQLHGKELSYNNLLDTDAAYKLVSELPDFGCAIVKHSNPCGVAVAQSIDGAYVRAYECDTTSAFGGIIALNSLCTKAAAGEIAKIFCEVVIAPSFEEAALELLTAKKNLRILRAPAFTSSEVEVRRVAGGFLLQSPDGTDEATGAKVVTKAQPTEEQLSDLRLAWTVVKHVKSNAIVLVKDGAAVGVGAGQMSRVESTQLAAGRAGERAAGTVCASDAFFPFRDGLDAAVEAGATAVIQPGGSVRDDEVIEAADEHGIPMLFTGRRHFRH